MTIQEQAIKIAEGTIGKKRDELCNEIGLKNTMRILKAIETALETDTTTGQMDS